MEFEYKNVMAEGRILGVDFPKEQYIEEAHDKKMIVLHHTAGWDNARGMFDWWASNPQRVATCCGVEDSGLIVQGFSSRYYGWHVNVWSRYNMLPAYLKNIRRPASYYEKHSVGVEVTNWGPLQSRGGKLYAWPNDYGRKGKGVIIDPAVHPVTEYEGDGFRGHRYYESYTEKQIETLYDLCVFWMDRYDIPFTFKGWTHFFDINREAISGARGIHTHVGFRTDKFDMHPQVELIQMLQALSKG